MLLPRFYPILDSELLTRCGADPVAAAEALLEAGVRILQFRHKPHYSRAAFAAAEQIARHCADAGVLFIVNDRADIAALLGVGLHLGQDDLPASLARTLLGPRAVLGFSTHNETQLRASADEPADYIAVGPVFATGSKRNPDPVLGVGELRRLRSLTVRPLAAIGGITLENARQVLDAGADSVAVIAGLLPQSATPAALRERALEWVRLTA